MAHILQAIIIFFVLGSEFFIRYKFVWVNKHHSKETIIAVDNDDIANIATNQEGTK